MTTALLRALIRPDISFCDAMQFFYQFHSHDLPKRILRSQQQGSPLARTEIHESKLIEFRRQVRHHLVEQARFGGLIRRMKQAKQSLPPSHRSAGGVDPLIPLSVHMAIALPSLFGS